LRGELKEQRIGRLVQPFLVERFLGSTPNFVVFRHQRDEKRLDVHLERFRLSTDLAKLVVVGELPLFVQGKFFSFTRDFFDLRAANFGI
jgi:hypothetical protein